MARATGSTRAAGVKPRRRTEPTTQPTLDPVGPQVPPARAAATGARFTALMYSVVGTLNLNGIDVLRWLEEWLAACAANGRRPPEDLSPWLPWSMSEERKRSFTAPG